MKKVVIKWLDKPAENNYLAAKSYLSLIFDEGEVIHLIDRLSIAPISHIKAKDIFRASSLSLLGVSNSHVKKDQKKIKEQISLSPILLVRDTKNGKVIVADGYHRLCAIYSYNEDAIMPCKIA